MISDATLRDSGKIDRRCGLGIGIFRSSLGDCNVLQSLKATGWEKCFSNFNLHEKHLGILLMGTAWDSSNKLLGDAGATGL